MIITILELLSPCRTRYDSKLRGGWRHVSNSGTIQADTVALSGRRKKKNLPSPDEQMPIPGSLLNSTSNK